MRARSAFVRLAAFVLLAIFAGCAVREEGWKEVALPDRAVAILERGAEQNDAAAEILKAAFPHALRLQAEQFVTAGPTLRQDGVVLVVPHLRTIPPPLWSALTNHLARGGLALFWGLDPNAASGDAECPLLRPAAEFFTLAAREVHGIDGGLLASTRPLRLQSPFPRPTGSGTTTDPSQRWIPLADAKSPSGMIRGWPASLWVDARDHAPLRAWGWIGWDPDRRHAKPQRALLQLAAARLYKRQFLLHAGLDRYALEAGEAFNIRARLDTAIATTGPWRVTAELENEEGVVTRRVVESIAPASPVSQIATSLFLGAVSRRVDRPEQLTLRVAAVNPADEQPFDKIQQQIRLRPESTAPRSVQEDRIGVRGSTFIIGRRPIALIGADYAPLTDDRTRNGLDPEIFNPALLDRDLDLFRDAGFNVVALRYTNLKQAPQLRIVLDELRARQLWALLEMPALSPWAPDWDMAKKLYADLRLAPDHRIFAITPGLIAPPACDTERERLTAAWSQWLREQYGSPGRAEKQLGAEEGSPIPTAGWTSDTNAPTAYRLAVRRFLNDVVGRHYGDCRTFLRQCGWTGLFTASSGTTLDPSAGAHHLDFISLDGAALDPTDRGRAEFYTTYARAVSGGKPVLWINVSSAMSYPPSNETQQQQAVALDLVVRAIVRAHASGVVAGGFSGGPGGADGTDIGLTNPEGTWRPGGEIFRSHVQDWRREQIPPLPWHGQTVETVIAPDGLAGIWADWRERAGVKVQSDTVEELRPAGWGIPSTDEPLVGLGGAKIGALEPLRSFNAEWAITNAIAPDRSVQAHIRQPVQLELINTGLARWSPSITGRVGAVWISAERQRGKSILLPLRETPPGNRCSITWTPADSGSWTLRPLVYPGAPFGEALHVEVE